MNGQIVLCKGLNDGRELEDSIEQLMRYLPTLESVSVVPVGLSKYREGLFPLEPFEKEDACQVIDLIERYQWECFEKYGTHFVHASDEWYILAGRELPEAERYDGYLQLENGVGMTRLLLDEFAESLVQQKECDGDLCVRRAGRFSLATGLLAYPTIQKLCQDIMDTYPNIELTVYPIKNYFFGEHITVSGLLTGQDLIAQLSGQSLGQGLFLPENILRSGEDVFLDDYHVADLEKALQVPLFIVKSSGYDFLKSIIDHTILV